MNTPNPFVDLYSGTEGEVLRVKDILETQGIPSIVQDDHRSGNLGGFFGGTPSTVRLKVQESDYKKARALIKDS